MIEADGRVQRRDLKRLMGLMILLIIVFVAPGTGWCRTDYLSFKTEDETNNIEIFKKAGQLVVYVTNKALRRDMFSFNVYEIPSGTGSGFIWDDRGTIVTNYHVVEHADVVLITLQDQTSWEAELVGLAPEKDIAVLRINAPREKLVPLPLGDSKLLEVGRKVLAIGNPFGLDTTLTVGIVSALGREINSVNNRVIHDVIQTDAAINPGNSGGPLLNSLGQLIGINTAIYSPSGANVGIGFAIPVDTVKKIVPQLIQYGHILRPVIGIEMVPDHFASRYGIEGVIVLSISRGYPADIAGMKGIARDYRGNVILGDVIVAIDGKKVINNDSLYAILEEYKPGDTITVDTLRNRTKRSYRIKLVLPR